MGKNNHDEGGKGLSPGSASRQLLQRADLDHGVGIQLAVVAQVGGKLALAVSSWQAIISVQTD